MLFFLGLFSKIQYKFYCQLPEEASQRRPNLYIRLIIRLSINPTTYFDEYIYFFNIRYALRVLHDGCFGVEPRKLGERSKTSFLPEIPSSIFFELLQITLHLRTYSVLNVLVVLVLLPTQRSDHFLCILCIKYNIREDFRVSVCPSQFCFPFLFRRSGFFTGRHFEIGIP